MEQSFDVSSPAELDVRLASGEIEIQAIEGATRVDVELIAHDEESQQHVDAARIELHDNHGRPQVIVDVPQRRGSFSLGSFFGRQGITCRLRAPEHSRLSVRSKSADVRARGTLGAANIQTASGDVSLDVVRGPVNAATASGDLRIGAAWDNVNANTVSGDQEHGAVLRGTVAAHSVSGDIHIGVRRGSKVFLDCNTVSGDTRSELELTTEAPSGDGPLVEIRAKTVSGDIAITRAPAPADNAQEVHA